MGAFKVRSKQFWNPFNWFRLNLQKFYFFSKNNQVIPGRSSERHKKRFFPELQIQFHTEKSSTR